MDWKDVQLPGVHLAILLAGSLGMLAGHFSLLSDPVIGLITTGMCLVSIVGLSILYSKYYYTRVIKLGTQWGFAGSSAVDSGLISFSDPMYTVEGQWKSRFPTNEHFFQYLGDEYPTAKCIEFSNNVRGLGVVLSAGYGDGVYPVFYLKGESGEFEGRIRAAMIVFDHEFIED